MRTKLQPTIDGHLLTSGSDRLLASQLSELSRREHVSILVAYLAVITVTLVHWNIAPTSNSIGWFFFMSIALLIRFITSKKSAYLLENNIKLASWRNLRVFTAALYGTGWGTILFLLDTGKLDFFFMFKFAAIAAAMGVTVNAMSVLLSVYVGFVTPIVLMSTSFIFANAPYLNLGERISLFSGVVAYFVLLLIAARNSSELTREALKQRFEREAALSRAKDAEQAVRASEERLRLAMISSNQGWFDLDLLTNQVIVSPEYPRMLGYNPEDFHSDMQTWLEHVHPDDLEALKATFRVCVGDGGPHTMEYRRQTKSGDWKWIRSVGEIVQWDDNHHALRMIGIHTDITQFKKYEQQLEHSAHYDSLTGLPNRVLFADRLNQAMVQAKRRNSLLALSYMDIDGFKSVNDSHGHDVGDKLLNLLANRMKSILRDGDTLVRFGGDEFIAVLPDLTDVEAIVPMFSRLLDVTTEPVQIDNLILKVSVSIGVTIYPQSGDPGADQLMRQADQAMYEAKKAGKNRYHFFNPA